MKVSEKVVKTPFGEVTVRVKKEIRSYKTSPFIIRKVEEAEQTLAALKVSLPQE
ncbi:MAG: hypothetical protein LH609_23495 [Rudanella sp.]|nr:hypothetical protein [Rudanella sp.]